MRSSFLNFIPALLLAVVSPGSELLAHEEAGAGETLSAPQILGVLDFENSGRPEAQDAFERGVMLLHSFEYDDARDAFLEAQEIDADFAMAVWGEAMTHNHPLWLEQDRAAGLAALAKLLPAARLRISDRERMFVAAVTTLYGEGSKPQRDLTYRQAMRGLYEKYPDDLEAATFYALSILGSVYERDFRTYMQAASILEEVFAKQPQHPGAAHYLIHSYDDQIHAPLGIRAARAYNRIAPSASHAQHMVSHIYLSLGMWDEVIAANIEAVRVSEQSMRRAGNSVANRSKHSLAWLSYGLLQQGRYDEARQTLVTMRDDLAEIPNGNHLTHSVLMRSAYIVEDPGGDSLLAPVDVSSISLDLVAIDAFASAFKHAGNDDVESAQDELDRLRLHIADARVLTAEQGLHEDPTATSPDGYLIATIIARELEALLKFRNGETDSALALLGTAAADEAARPMEYGPPYVPKPCSELLGEMLLALGRPGEAIPHFEASLSRNPGRALSLLGLARAKEAVGDVTSRDSWDKVESAWKGDPQILRNLPYSWLGADSAAAAVRAQPAAAG